MSKKSWESGAQKQVFTEGIAEWRGLRMETMCRALQAKGRILVFGPTAIGRYWRVEGLPTEDKYIKG